MLHLSLSPAATPGLRGKLRQGILPGRRFLLAMVWAMVPSLLINVYITGLNQVPNGALLWNELGTLLAFLNVRSR